MGKRKRPRKHKSKPTKKEYHEATHQILIDRGMVWKDIRMIVNNEIVDRYYYFA